MRIVIIEDEERARRGLASMIQLLNCDCEVVAQAADGRRGLELILKLKPDLVFTDIKMPIVDGLEMISLVRSEGLETRFVIISAHENFDYAKEAISYGVTDYIVKPILVEEIEVALKKACEALEKCQNSRSIGFGLDQSGSTNPKESDQAWSCFIKGEAECISECHPAVQKALEIISREYSAKLTQDELAQRLRITPAYFSYLFHRDVGITFSSYLKRYRVDVAASMLKDKQMKIYDAAAIAGYTDTKYFCRVFKEVMGCSPTEYMRNHQPEHE